MSKWAAVYCPSDGAGSSANRFDFSSEFAATQYVFSRMCEGCKRERDRVLSGNADGESSAFPGCFWEWMILPTSEWEECQEDNPFVVKVPTDILKQLSWPNGENKVDALRLERSAGRHESSSLSSATKI